MEDYMKNKLMIAFILISILMTSIAYANDVDVINVRDADKLICNVAAKELQNGNFEVSFKVDAGEKNIEIMKYPGIYSDENLENKYETNMQFQDNVVKCQIDSNNDKLFIKAPLVATIDEQQKIKAKLRLNENTIEKIELNDGDWLEIIKMDTYEVENDEYLRIGFNAKNQSNIFPRKVKLLLNGEIINGLTGIIFDENNDLKKGCFIYKIPNNVNDNTEFEILIDSLATRIDIDSDKSIDLR
jgi:hypothetical protein